MSVIEPLNLLRVLPSDASKVCVAISGGADSLCLTLLLNDLANSYCRFDLVACFVDHRLRDESSTEIIPIIDLLKSRGIKHEVLVWYHDCILTNVQSKAREKRYELLFDFCCKNGIGYLATAHHALDQWETFFMRLARGSGISGLSCMSHSSIREDITILRPLLAYTRSDIENTLLQKYGIGQDSFVHDPSNKNEKYERVRWRAKYGELSKIGLDMKNICRSIDRISRADGCLDSIALGIFGNVFYPELHVINLSKFKTHDIELRMRVMVKVLRCLSFDKHVSYESLEALCIKISSPDFKSTNVFGFLFVRFGGFCCVMLHCN